LPSFSYSLWGRGFVFLLYRFRETLKDSTTVPLALPLWTGKGAVEWTELSWLQSPQQARIIKALAELPILEMGPPG